MGSGRVETMRQNRRETLGPFGDALGRGDQILPDLDEERREARQRRVIEDRVAARTREPSRPQLMANNFLNY